MGKRKQILFLASWYPEVSDPVKGLFIRKHAMQIAQLHDVSVVYFELGQFVSEQVVKNHEHPGLTEYIYRIPKPGSGLGLLKCIFRMNRILIREIRNRSESFDFIHLNVAFPAGVLFYPAIYLSKLPIIITEHWSGYFVEDSRFFKLSFWKKWLIHRLFARSKAVTTVSDVLRKRISEVFDLSDNICVVPNVVEVPCKSKIQLKNDSDTVTALAVCTFDDMAKNISGMLKAIAEIKKRKIPLRLVLIGDGPDFIRMRAFADELGLIKDDVTFTGYLNAEQINHWYLESDFYLLNSYFETFSISTAEALLAGLPVVATRCKGPEEYIDDASGIFIRPGVHEELVGALLEMSQSFHTYDPSAIIDRVKKKLYVGSVSDKFNEVYNKYLS